MYKKHNNPTVEELTETCRKRSIRLTDLTGPENPAVPAEEIRAAYRDKTLRNGRDCFWCLTALTGRKIKWCSQECSNAAFAWANPQSEEGLAQLLARQLYRCNGCQYDWNPLADSLLGRFGIPKALDRLTQSNPKFVKMVKNRSAINGRKPEVDHIIPIAKGGSSLSLTNLQALCYTCHKAKSKLDNSGPRKKR